MYIYIYPKATFFALQYLDIFKSKSKTKSIQLKQIFFVDSDFESKLPSQSFPATVNKKLLVSPTLF